MIAIIDYKAGNSPSVLHATRRLGVDASLVNCEKDIEKATHIILPGVGNARPTIQSLRETGLLNAIEDAVLRRKVNFLGICVGLQILFEHSEEEDTKCLGWLRGNVVKFDASKLRVPQMGWNKVEFVKETPIDALESYYYFVNSYYAKPEDASDVWGVSDYGGNFTAAVNRDNIYAAQFHIEKSGEAGLSILKEFCSLSY